MAAPALEFSANRRTGKLHLSTFYADSFRLPDLMSKDTVFLKIHLVEPDPSSGDGALKILDPAGLSCKVAIGDRGDDSPQANATLAIVEKHFEGKLILNVQAIADLFASVNVVDRFLEIRISSGTEHHTLLAPVRIWKAMISEALTDPPAPDEALGKNEARERYVGFDNEPGRGVIFRSQDGTKARVLYLGNDGALHDESIT